MSNNLEKEKERKRASFIYNKNRGMSIAQTVQTNPWVPPIENIKKFKQTQLNIQGRRTFQSDWQTVCLKDKPQKWSVSFIVRRTSDSNL